MLNRFLPGFLIGVAFTVLAVAAGAFALAKTGLIPANADAKPSLLERRFAGMARDAAVNRYAPTDENPVKLSDDNLMAGMKLYKDNCQSCHGGPTDVDNKFGQAMYPSVPQFPARKKPIDLSEQQLYYVGKHGFRLTGMPAFTTMMSDDELWKTALFIKHMSDLPLAVKEAWQKP